MPAPDNETERIRRIYDRKAATAPSAKGNANLRWLCGGAEGETLEVGIGRGRTLAFYPPDVRLTGIELSDVALEIARRRALELGIPATLRQGDAAAILEDLFPRLCVGGRGRCEHVAVHVAARGERGEQRLVDALDHRAQAGFQYAMKLDGLARGNTQRIVAILGRQPVEHAPLIGRHHATGDAAADHHDVFLAGLAQVAVILLVGAVKLQELVFVLGKMVGVRVVQRRGDGAGERRRRFLDDLVVR